MKTRENLRRFLFSLTDVCQFMQKKLIGAADMLSAKKAISLLECERQNWQNVRPCFVLSTGRCGTMLLNKLLLLSPNAFAVHRPEPELLRPSKFAYENIKNQPDVLAQIFKACREELVFRAVQRDKVYIETNNRITFFGPVIRNVFPNAVFIHLVRHPADFVRSGMRRQWYSGSHTHDVGRITPMTGPVKKAWVKLSRIEKIGWLWNETNAFIESFTAKLDNSQYVFVRAEELFGDAAVIEKIYDFCGLENFHRNSVKRLLKKPVNRQKRGSFPAYDDWPESMQLQLQRIAPLMGKYGYT